MAETHLTESPSAMPSPPPLPRSSVVERGFRPMQFLVPAVFVTLIPVAFYTPRLWVIFDMDPGPLVPVTMGAMLTIVLSTLGLAAWLLFFAPLRRSMRLLAFAVVFVLPPAVMAALVRKVEFTGNMKMLFTYRWQRDRQHDLDEHLARQRALPQDDLPAIDVTVDPDRDFPCYRGTRSDGVVRGVRLKADGGAMTDVWKQPCGGGYAGFAVAGNVLVTIEQRKDKEAIVCYDQVTGRQRWEYEYQALFSQTENMGGDGSRATPAIADGDVYSLGALGHLVCLNGTTGAKKWSVNIVDDCESEVIKWGMTSSPLVVDDKVIVCAGVKPTANAGKSMAAYDRNTGKRVWAHGDKQAGYGSPMLATLAGKRQILMFDGGGLAGFDPDTGAELWRQEWLSFNEMNIIQPLLCGDDRVYISSDPPRGGAMLRIVRSGDGFKVETVWKNRYLCAGYSNPVLYKGHLYGLSTGVLVCLEAETGKRVWRGGNYGNGQILLVDDVLFITEEQEGDAALVKATPDGFKQLSRRKVFDGKTWNTPAIVGDKVYLRNHVEMACLRLPVAE